MQIDFQLCEADFVQAYHAHRDRTVLNRWAERIVLWGSTIFVLSIFFGLLAQHGDRLARSYLPLPCLALLWILLLQVWPRWEMKQQFRKQPGAHGPRTVLFDDEGAHWRWDGGSSDILWKNYIRWTEGDKQILLYSSPACFSMLPKRALDPAQLAELRQMLKQKIQQAR